MMNNEAIEKSKERLEIAKSHFAALASAKNYQEAKRPWYGFLISSNSIFSILEQGTKKCKASKQWFKAKNLERRNDPLLSYLRGARNAEEHGAVSISAHRKPKIVLVEGNNPTAVIDEIEGASGTFRHLDDKTPEMSKVTVMRVYPDRIRLLPIADRKGTYDLPTQHLGVSLEDDEAIPIAKLMIDYLGKMIDEAEALLLAKPP